MEKDFLGVYQIIGVHQGVDDQLIRIMGLLALSPESLPLDIIAKKTGYSLASVSNKVTMLESFGILRKSRMPGSRKVYAVMEKDSLRMWRDVSKRKADGFNAAIQKLPPIIEKYKTSKLNPEQKKKLANMQRFLKLMTLTQSILDEMIVKLDKAMKETEK